MYLSHWFDQKRLNQSCALAKTKRILILRANFRAHSKAVYIHPLMPKAFYALLLVLIGSSHFAALCVESRIRSRQRSKTENPSTPSERLH